MDDEPSAELFDLADLILAVGRQIHAAKDVAGESWTPLESAVMRVIDRSPGLTSSAAAESTQVISSNFSRAVRVLEGRGLVRREVDKDDGRRVRLYPTPKAQGHLRHLHEVWSRLLEGIVEPADVHATAATLRRIEGTLGARAARDGVG